MEEFIMNAQMITNIHEDIVRVLIERLEKRPEQAFLTYDELCRKIENQVGCRNVASYLGDISCWCGDIGAPMLSALVINGHSNRPGKGFFKLYAELHGLPMKQLDEEVIFVSEAQKVIRYHKWNKLKFYLGI